MSDKKPLSSLQQRILQQRTMLHNMLLDPMQLVANQCVDVWYNKESLDETLMKTIKDIPYCTYSYALDKNAVQISDNASQTEQISKDFERDRSARPYILELDPDNDMSLSQAYISLRGKRPSVTSIQKVFENGELIGYLGADFDLRDLPITKDLYKDPGHWRQMKGDPSIRGQVFQQNRVTSRLDKQLDVIQPVLEELMTNHGVFHVKIHYSSSRATVWFVQDPYRYQLLDFEDLVDPDICLAYPLYPYPNDAIVPKESINTLFDTFKQLRFADDTIYLRAGSINVFNGTVGLNFSCDGSHYIPCDQFLAKDSVFWEGI